MKNRPSLEYVKERFKNASILSYRGVTWEADTTILNEDDFGIYDKTDRYLYCFDNDQWAEIIEYKDQEPETKAKDPIVNNVIEQFLSRSNEGIEKYGTTLSDNNKDDFLQHLKEELMDAILYIEKVQEQIKEVKKFFN